MDYIVVLSHYQIIVFFLPASFFVVVCPLLCNKSSTKKFKRMNTPIKTLQGLCAKSPALRNLLQFDAARSFQIAELTSAAQYFYIYYNKAEDNFLINYRAKNGEYTQDDCMEGYIRCGSFTDVLEALDEELAEVQQGLKSVDIQPETEEHLWLDLQPVRILASFRVRFSGAVEQCMAKMQHSGNRDRFSRWLVFLNQLAISA
jgi:hypothetical protein